jgi:hypothetical protein
MLPGINEAKLPDMVILSENIIELRRKILKGIELAFEKLVESKSKNNSEFVFSRDGKIYFVKARDLKECYESK